MAQTPQVPLPPASAEYVNTTQLANPGAVAEHSAMRMFRAGDGKTRLDFGHNSVIHNPAAGETTVLDHLTKEARVLPLPPPGAPLTAPPPPHPGLPALPTVPTPALSVKDLGKRFLGDGHEVEGRQFSFQPPSSPKPPTPPVSGTVPRAPGPAVPAIGPIPQLPHTAEVWTSTKLRLPMLTRVKGSFGQQTSVCKSAVPGEPHPALFQIPPGYRRL